MLYRNNRNAARATSPYSGRLLLSNHLPNDTTVCPCLTSGSTKYEPIHDSSGHCESPSTSSDGGAMVNRDITRRHLLASTAILAVAGFGLPARGRTYRGGSLPWDPNDTSPPIPVRTGPWLYFTADEAAAVAAIADRLIPPDDFGPGGKQAGCAGLLDR